MILKSKDLQYLFETIPKIERLYRIVIDQAFTKFTQLSIDLQTLSAKDRYVKMLKEYPDISQKVPVYHIANFLGITPSHHLAFEMKFSERSNLVTNVEQLRLQ